MTDDSSEELGVVGRELVAAADTRVPSIIPLVPLHLSRTLPPCLGGSSRLQMAAYVLSLAAVRSKA
jgi:hypothetical protein